jgi:hypothetical protein
MDKHEIEMVVKNSEGKRTAWFGLGEMDLVDVVDIEKDLLKLFIAKAEAQSKVL